MAIGVAPRLEMVAEEDTVEAGRLRLAGEIEQLASKKLLNEYQEKLDWAAEFVREEVEPLSYVIKHPLDMKDPTRKSWSSRCRKR